MKKRLIALYAVLFSILFAFPLFAQSLPIEYTSLGFADEKGSYVVYHDTRNGANAYIGLLFSEGNKLFIRLYESDSGHVLLASQTFYTVPKGATPDKSLLDVEPGTINLLSGDFGATPYSGKVLSEVYGWIDAWLHSRSQFDEASDYDFDETYRYRFEYWIPILQMRAADVRGEAPSGKISDDVELVTAGVVESMTDPTFFSFTGEVKTVKGPSYAITAGNPLPASIDGLEILLDSNWARGADGAYRISRESPQDAFCRVETLDVSEFGTADTFDLIKLFILYSGGILMPEDLRIFASGGYPCLFYRVCDPVTRKVTAQYRLFIPKDETHLSVLSFGAFESLYDANKEYFDSTLF